MPRLVILLLLLCPAPVWAQVAHDGEADLNARLTGTASAGPPARIHICPEGHQ